MRLVLMGPAPASGVVPACHERDLRLGPELLAQLALQLGEALVDVTELLVPPHHVLAVAGEEVADGLDADLDRPRGLVLVDVLEAEVRRTGVLDDLLDDRVDRGVVTALEG